MASCGPFEVVVDARGQVLAVGVRIAQLANIAASDVVGKPVSRWLRGAAVTGPVGASGSLELSRDNRAALQGVGVRSVDGERTTITFVPDPGRVEATRSRGDRSEPDPRTLEVGREIQDALTGIIGFAGLVPVAPTPHRRKFYVDQVVSQAERVRRLVQAFEPGGRGDGATGRGLEAASTPFIGPADVGLELTRALSGLRASLERGGVGFDIELPKESVWASCDIRQVGDLVSALIQRATVQQRRDYQANEVVLTVRRAHAGPSGLRPEAQPRGQPIGPTSEATALIEIILTGADQPHALLRERFGTDPASNSPSLSESELRLGLQALQRQGGHFTLGQEPEREEVRLTLSLPSAPAPRRADKLRTPVPLEILVVDDDPMLGELYQEMLQVAGHSVTACRSIFAAREALRGQRFDAVVAEFVLKDGLLSELWAVASQAHPELASRLIVATREARDGRLIEWAGQQSVPILAKPFSAAALQDQLALLV